MKRLLCAFIIVSAAVFHSQCLADDSWTINTIAYGIEGSASVAVDINNMPIVVSRNYPQDLVFIAQTPNGYETNSIPQTSNSLYPRLKVTSNNELAILFLKDGGVWYGSKSDWFDWVFSQIEDSSVMVTDMVLTDNDIPHIVYDYQKWIYHSYYDVHSQQWVKERLSGFGNYAFKTAAIDIDSEGRIMILCSEDGNIRIAIYSDGYWNYLPLLQGYGADGSFTADNLSAAAFVRSGQLIYAVYINDIIGWVENAVGPASLPIPIPVSLAHSSTGVPGIAYIDNDYSKLMYAANVSGGWTTTQIDERCKYPELIFDHSDKPLIVYSSHDGCLSANVIKLAGIGLEPFNIADLNNDKIVNFKDFAVIAENWMTILPQPDLSIGDFNQDAKVDALDLRWLGCNWLYNQSG
jgi:hypothetical protein